MENGILLIIIINIFVEINICESTGEKVYEKTVFSLPS